jgi:hypothetical protein
LVYDLDCYDCFDERITGKNVIKRNNLIFNFEDKLKINKT